MRSVVEIEILAPRIQVAELYGDPSNSPHWIRNLESYEPASGTQGLRGSRYRLTGWNGRMSFLATITSRTLPDSLRIVLDSPLASVAVHALFTSLPSGATRLVSTEVVRFKGGIFQKAKGFLVTSFFRSNHRSSIEAFKEFAERMANPAAAPGCWA